MPLAAGTRLGPYEIIAPLGAGGMGEVYRARDARLSREVAIKALPAEFAQDPERLARFEREAKLLASLSHPNIAGIYGLEEAGGARYLALEFIAGESLDARLGRGPLPLEEALDVARQIAAGIEAAHEKDVIHRDLKPGNVMLSTSGTVKVLDFGLAKSGAADRAGSDPNLAASPTMTFAATQAGVILGTAAYMSPEQARGRAVDKRTDVWSFGCIVYECLTGRQAFGGETVSDIVARILQTEPEWRALSGNVPERLRALLARCFEKDARRRLRDIGDARIEIEDVLAARRSSSGTVRTAVAARGGRPWAAIAATAVIVAAASGLLPRLFTRSATAPAARFEVAAPKGQTLAGGASVVALSPDGRMLAMTAQDSSGTLALWVRPLDELVPRRLPGTEGVRQVFWSPDSRWIGFFANDRSLFRIAVDAGTAERICDTKAARGGAWAKDGTILLAPFSNGGIFRVPASGGTPVQVTRPDSAHGITGHRFPLFLPDGKHFLFSTVPADADGKVGICVGSIGGGPIREIGRSESGVAWVGPGWLVTTRNLALVTWKFDARSLKVVGEPVVIGDALVASGYSGGPLMSAAGDGTLAFMTREDIPVRATWYDVATGRKLGEPPLATGVYGFLALAPDGHHALLSDLNDPTRADLVLADLDRGVVSHLSQSPENVGGAVWSKDGTQIAYLDQTSRAIKVHSLADGSTHDLLADDRAFKRVYAWMPDGSALIYGRLDAVTKWDIWMLPVAGGPPKPVLRSPANDENAGVSPDGRWLEYQTDESGVSEVCVAPLATPGLKYQVTIGGGAGGFAYDGRRFYAVSTKEPNLIRVAAIRTGPTFSLGPLEPAFRLPEGSSNWDLAHDEQRLLVLMPTEKPAPQAATVLQNWRSAIRKP